VWLNYLDASQQQFDAACCYRRSSVIWLCVCMSVCLSVCLSVGDVREPCKQLNGPRCRLGAALREPEEQWIRWGPDTSTGMGNFGWLSGPLKSNGSHCCGVRSKGIAQSSITAWSESDHPIFNNGTTCDATFCQHSLTTCYASIQGNYWLLLVNYRHRNVVHITIFRIFSHCIKFKNPENGRREIKLFLFGSKLG